jgi:seryl-tRNA synthetase
MISTDKHPLSDELRKLADQYAATDEFGYARQFGQALHQAADALDAVDTHRGEVIRECQRVMAERDSLTNRIRCLEEQREAAHRAYTQLRDERDSLKQQLEIVERGRGEYRNLAHDKIIEISNLQKQLEQVTAERDNIAKSWHDNAVFLNEQLNSAAMDFWNERERAEAAEAREAEIRRALEWYAARPRTEFTPLGAIDYAHDPEPAREALRAHEKAAGEGEG